MKKLAVLATCLFFAQCAIGAPVHDCNKETLGSLSCVAGEQMKCSKAFTPEAHEFIYEWQGVNASGQVFSVDNPLYRKVPGLTPVKCNGSVQHGEPEPGYKKAAS